MLNPARALFAPNSQFIAISLWIMQLLVLVMLVRDLVITSIRKRKLKTRRRKLFALMAQGQGFEHNVPTNGQHDRITQWDVGVKNWIEETSDALNLYSAQAAAAFNQGVGVRVDYRHVHGGLQETYGLLLRRLESLRGVMEKPDVYY